MLDPFSGSGTTVAVARSLGRDAVGVDLSHGYCLLGRWQVESGRAAAASERVATAAEAAGQVSLFDLLGDTGRRRSLRRRGDGCRGGAHR